MPERFLPERRDGDRPLRLSAVRRRAARLHRRVLLAAGGGRSCWRASSAPPASSSLAGHEVMPVHRVTLRPGGGLPMTLRLRAAGSARGRCLPSSALLPERVEADDLGAGAPGRPACRPSRASSVFSAFAGFSALGGLRRELRGGAPARDRHDRLLRRRLAPARRRRRAGRRRARAAGAGAGAVSPAPLSSNFRPNWTEGSKNPVTASKGIEEPLRHAREGQPDLEAVLGHGEIPELVLQDDRHVLRVFLAQAVRQAHARGSRCGTRCRSGGRRKGRPWRRRRGPCARPP